MHDRKTDGGNEIKRKDGKKDEKKVERIGGRKEEQTGNKETEE